MQTFNFYFLSLFPASLLMRIKGLDFLRGVAIIGVLFRHFEIDFFLAGPGGYGVDLFFVLSGFLVSGLLFSEYKRRGEVNVKRFLIRRGFKIYPAFYFFIFCTVLLFSIGFGTSFQATSILSEVFFLQSYIGGMWSHTWSLAVEEHFYFLLAIIIFIAIKRRLNMKGHFLPILFSCLIVLSLVLRIIYVYRVYSVNHDAFFYTHLRIDGLLTGALLGFFWHFRPILMEHFYKNSKLFAFLSFLMIMPSFIFNSGSLFMVTIGFNIMHVGFAFAVLLLISAKGEKVLFENVILSKISSAIAFIGVYSYSIYLWHLPVQNLLLRYVPDLRIEAILYMVLSVFTGIVTSAAIEKPMLRLREKHFPRN